ncbi:hypothetical protein [Phytohabitans kaempferiae]|uniref:Transcription factor zinc-finger domain-containing protein n=1 Tax=Phytohabitans kaempferiae TaxID=1620943 RepID=A0ABV6LZJ5_9ACTN
MAPEDSTCMDCGGLVTAERVSAHPSGITIEYGECLACGSRLRRILASGIDAPAEPPGPWMAIAAPRAAPRRRHRSLTRPPRGVGTRRPGR